MGFIEIFFLAVGLAFDAFAVSIGCASCGQLDDKRSAFRLAFHFGIFQALMPIAGWLVGAGVNVYVETFDHWIAFILLLYVGVKMVSESMKKEEDRLLQNPSKGRMLVILSVATSIDALVVGFSLALIRIDIFYPAAIIGIVTASLSLIGIGLGARLGKKIGRKMEFIGGLIIISIGLKILYTHISTNI